MIQVQQNKVPSDFYNGLDLLSRKARLTLPVKSTLLANDPIALIKRKRWESEIPWPSKIAFQERLAGDGFTEDMFADTLSAPLHLLADKGEVPPWMTTIEKCYNSEKQLVDISIPPEIERHPLRPFLKVALPLLEETILVVRKCVGGLGTCALAKGPYRSGDRFFDPAIGREDFGDD